MARLLSPVWSTIRGSIGGTTYLSNQWHQIVARQRTAPVNPSTPSQGIIRSAFSAASGNWQDLTDAERQGWDDYAETCQYQGPLGNYTVPGRQMFLATRTLAIYGNAIDPSNFEAPIDTPPTTPGFLNPGEMNPSTPTDPLDTGIALNINNYGGVTIRGITEHSFAFPSTRNRYKGPFLSSTAQLHIVPADTLQKIEYTGLPEGAVYFLRVRWWTPTTENRISQEYIFRLVSQVGGT